MANIVGSLTYKKSACKCLYEVYKKKGDYQRSLDRYIQFQQYNDSLQIRETTKRLDQMEFAKQIVRDSVTRESSRLEANSIYEAKIYRRNSLQYMGIAVVLLMLTGWLFFARRMKLPKWLIDVSLFVPFLVFFRFMSMLTEPVTSSIIGDAPLQKMLVSVVLAAIVTPSHRFIEKLVRHRLFSLEKQQIETDKNR